MSRPYRFVLMLAIVALAFILGYAIGARAEARSRTNDRHFVPIPAELAQEPVPLPSPTAVAGLHEYQQPVDVAIPVATAIPGDSRRRPVAGDEAGSDGSRDRADVRRSVHHQLRGVARWHATGRDGLYAAAGCELRRAIGPSWRGSTVLVAIRRRAIEVWLNDVIGRLRSGRCSRTLIDLSDEAFAYLRPLSRGVIKVTVGW